MVQTILVHANEDPSYEPPEAVMDLAQMSRCLDGHRGTRVEDYRSACQAHHAAVHCLAAGQR